MIALILAAGYGTRMYPLTEHTPKALLPVKGRAILDYLLDRLSDPHLGVREIVLVSNHRFAEMFRQWFLKWPGSIPWRVLDDGSTSDGDKLGSVGDLAFAIRTGKIEEDLLVVGSDNLFDGSLRDFIEFARFKQAVALGAYELSDRKMAKLYGVLSVDSQWRVCRFAEKPEQPESALVSTAIYFFPHSVLPKVLEYVALQQRAADTMGSFIAWLISRESVYAYPFRGLWVDIGDMASYQKAQEIVHP